MDDRECIYEDCIRKGTYDEGSCTACGERDDAFAAGREAGMREAAGIAKGVGAAHRISGYSSLERIVLVEVYERILSAIGTQEDSTSE